MPDGSSSSSSSIGPSRNPAFVLKGINDVVFEDRPMPDASNLGPLDVLVAPKATGICGSDVHYLRHGSIGDFVVKAPMILGHESSGLVAAVGSAVKDLKVGDRVALEPGKMCRHCNVCKHGMYELCKDMEFAATPPYDGTLAGFYTLPSDLCYKLPENVSMEEGCMIEPLSVGVQSVAKLAKLRPNENIVILGAGPVGLLCMAVAKAFGARRIIAIDINAERLEFAKNYAATDIWSSTPKNTGESTMEYARRQASEITSKMGFGHPTSTNAIDVVIDCTGAPVCIATGIFLVKSAGRYIQVGMGPDNVEIPLSTALTKMVNMQGSFRYGAGVYQLAIDLVAQGKINLKPLITHEYKFDQAKEAFQCMIDNKGHDGKAPIKCIIAGPEA